MCVCVINTKTFVSIQAYHSSLQHPDYVAKIITTPVDRERCVLVKVGQTGAFGGQRFQQLTSNLVSLGLADTQQLP
eukprot:COSAG06_NODE_16979_length_969_cov_1.504598_1_plen_75_part_10